MPFEKGHKKATGRPAGVPNKATAEIRDFARSILEHPEVRALTLRQAMAGELSDARWTLLMHYAYGKPKETVEHQGDTPITILLKRRGGDASS